MINITGKIKKAISTDAAWVFSDFYAFIEMLNERGLDVSHWEGEENWATIAVNEKIVVYIWLKYPLMFIEEKYTNILLPIPSEFDYIESIILPDLNADILTIDLDDELIDRINPFFDPKAFCACDFWFNSVN